MESAPVWNTAETNSDNSAAAAGETYYLVQVKDIDFYWHLTLLITARPVFAFFVTGLLVQRTLFLLASASVEYPNFWAGRAH
jgi:hypothetical protein